MSPNDIAVRPEKEVSTYLEQAKSFRINSLEDLAIVDAHCAAGLALKKKIQSDFKESKEAAWAAHKAIVAQEAGHLDGIEEGRKVDKLLIAGWNEQQEALAAEQARIAQEAETKRLEDEALDRAARAAEFGDVQTADAIISAPIVTTPAQAYQATKTATTFQTRWGATIQDEKYATKTLGSVVAILDGIPATPAIKKALELLAEIEVAVGYMKFDQVALNRQATATKDALRVGGVAFSSRKV